MILHPNKSWLVKSVSTVGMVVQLHNNTHYTPSNQLSSVVLDDCQHGIAHHLDTIQYKLCKEYSV